MLETKFDELIALQGEDFHRDLKTLKLLNAAYQPPGQIYSFFRRVYFQGKKSMERWSM